MQISNVPELAIALPNKLLSKQYTDHLSLFLINCGNRKLKFVSIAALATLKFGKYTQIHMWYLCGTNYTSFTTNYHLPNANSYSQLAGI